MEELTQLGHKRKNIFVKFLKINKIYGYFVANAICVRTKYYEKYKDINEIFNNYRLGEISFTDFFLIYSHSYPKNMRMFDKFAYWSNLEHKWIEYISTQQYRKYDIW